MMSAVEKGDARAQCYLALLYNNGIGVDMDYQEGLRLLRLSTGQGNAQAFYILGYSYYNGRGIIQNYEEAYYNWLLASALGYKADYKDRDIVAYKLNSEQISLIQARAQKSMDELNK